MINFKEFKTKAEIIKHIKMMSGEACRTTAQAEKYLRAHLPKESYYQGKIINYLKESYPGAFVWKASAGAYCRQGIPDVCAIIDGKFYGFEVKRPYIGILSEIQERTIEQIQAAGGIAGVVCFPEDAKK